MVEGQSIVQLEKIAGKTKPLSNLLKLHIHTKRTTLTFSPVVAII